MGPPLPILCYILNLLNYDFSPGSVFAHLVGKFNNNNPRLVADIKAKLDQYIFNHQSITDGVVNGFQKLPIDIRSPNIVAVAMIQDGRESLNWFILL